MKKDHPTKNAASEADNHRSISRKYSGDHTGCCVTFWLPREAAPDAKSVVLVGSFNDWSLDRHPMVRLNNGDFSLELELEAGKEYTFRFLIDGARWENAWNADKYVWSDYAQAENSVITT